MAHLSTTAASPKAAHYNAQITSALLKGAWADNRAAAAPNGTELSWSEAVRKWGKHTGGNTALVHHLRDISLLYLSSASHSHPSSSGYITVPSTNFNATVSSTTAGPPDQPGSSNSSDGATASTSASGSSFIHIPHPHRRKNRVSSDLPAGSSSGTVRALAGEAGARAAFLSPADLDGDDAEDETAWAEGNGWWSGVSVDQVDEVKEGIKAIEGLLSSGTLRPGEAVTAQSLIAYHLHAIGQHAGAIRACQAVNLTGNVKTGLVDGDASVLDRLRTACVLGMSVELDTGDVNAALEAYLSVVPLFFAFTNSASPIPSYLQSGVSHSQKLLFDSHREVYRHFSTALSRAAVLSSRTANITQTLRILRTYHAYSDSWAPTFRPFQRQRMLHLYLRALISGFPPTGVASVEPYLLGSGSTSYPARQTWQLEVIEAFNQGQRLLSATTTFPRAGSINVPVTAFTELCVALADQYRPLIRNAVGILWWSMNLTFQSQSVLRHLTRLLASSGNAEDARRTFELYVELVLKARQTHQPESSLQLKRRPAEDDAADAATIAKEAGEAEYQEGALAEERQTQTAEAELDTDEDFVEALLVGSRVLLKDLGEAEDAWRYVVLAGDVIEESHQLGRRISQSLKAEVEECKGIVRIAMPGAEPSNRATYQSQSINHLTTATALAPSSSSSFYHLAFCLAESRQIDQAVAAIRTSLQLDSQNVQAWHLLALLLTAINDWSGAAKACEAGITVWEEAEDTEDDEEVIVTDPGVEARDFAVSRVPPVPAPRDLNAEPILLSSGSLRPLRKSSNLSLPLSRSSRLHNVIQIRMTLNVIMEKTQGCEMAMLKQQELFSFFSARSGKNRDGKTGLNRSASVGSVRELGGSYISVPSAGQEVPAGGADQLAVPQNSISVIPPSPLDEGAPGLPSIVQPSEPSPGHSTSASDGEEMHSEKEKGHSSIRKVMTNHKLLPKHLHVPGARRTSRPSSVRRLTSETISPSPSAPDLTLHRQRSTSGSTVAPSIAPTAAYSHFHSRSPSHYQPSIAPPPPASNSTANASYTASEARILSNLWLMSAATFRRWGKLEQCLVAIEEAEVLDPENPDVWVQLGLYHSISIPTSYPSNQQSTGSGSGGTGDRVGVEADTKEVEIAQQAFIKSILLKSNHPPAIVSLSKLYLATGQVELAHSLLNQLTQDDAGWDVPEAWYYLAKVCERQGGRGERVRECLVYALGLEKGRTARRLEDAVERWL